MKTTINTGALELRGLYQRYVAEALMLAGLFHFTLIGGYQIYSSMTGDEVQFPNRFPPNVVYVLPPPPSLVDRVVLPSPTLGIAEKPSIGNPVPRPDAEINPETTIPTQPEMNEILNATAANVSNGTTEYINPGTIIENEEAPPIFQPVEKQPIAIRIIQPPYPSIPLKAGVEGTVYVNLWVTKEGKVKKVEIAKSTNDLFNQAALDAAAQWVFTPAIMNNGPVSVWVTVPFKFRLNSK